MRYLLILCVIVSIGLCGCVQAEPSVVPPSLDASFRSNTYQDVSQASVMLVHGVGCFGKNWIDTPFYAPLDTQGRPTSSVRDVYLQASKGKLTSRNIIEYEYDQRLLNHHDPYPLKRKTSFRPKRSGVEKSVLVATPHRPLNMLDLSTLTSQQSNALAFHYEPSWLTQVIARRVVGDRIEQKSKSAGRPLEYRCSRLNPAYARVSQDDTRDLFIHDNADASKYFNNTPLRLEIMNDFLRFVRQVQQKNGGRDLTIVAMSHGSVVAYEALLLRAKSAVRHPEKLHLVMLGSPMDGGPWENRLAGFHPNALLPLDKRFLSGQGTQAIGSVSAMCGARDAVCFSKAPTVDKQEALSLPETIRQAVRLDSRLLQALPPEHYTVTSSAHSMGGYAKNIAY